MFQGGLDLSTACSLNWGIPEEDRRYLFKHLEEEGFDGASGLEIRPRTPLQGAELTRKYFKRLFENQ